MNKDKFAKIYCAESVIHIAQRCVKRHFLTKGDGKWSQKIWKKKKKVYVVRGRMKHNRIYSTSFTKNCVADGKDRETTRKLILDVTSQ